MSARPELVVDGFPKRRARWVEIATSADHKDVGRILIAASLGFLFIALIELLLMRLQLAIPENTFLSPVAFNRMLSLYGATAIFFFAIPLALGLFYYLVPLQIGARGTALPRLGQIGAWLVIAGATVLYSGFLFTPSEAGVNPLAPLSELAFLANNGVDAWASATGLATLGFVLLAIDLTDDAAQHARARAWPGGGCRSSPGPAAIGSWLLLVIGPVMLAAITMLLIDRNFDGDLLRRRLRRRAAALAAPELDLLHRRLHADPDHGARRDRRNRPRLRPQTALQPRRDDRLAGRDRGDRHARLDAEHAHRADRDRLDVLRDGDVAGADRALRPDPLQPDRDAGRRHDPDAGAAAVRGRRDLDDLDRARRRRSATRWSPSPGS